MTVMAHRHTNADPGELYELAQAVAQVDPRRITTCVVRGRVGSSALRAWSSPTWRRRGGMGATPGTTPRCGRC